MSTQMTIIGLERTGASIGLGLASQKENLTRVGHDRHHETARSAEKLGAVDKVSLNIHNAVEKADLVVLAVPVDELRITLETIAEDLKENAVVLDTSPAMISAAAWAKELLPAGRFFVSFTPVENSIYLDEEYNGTEGAHADMFKNSLIAIACPPGTDGGAMKLAADLAGLLDAAPYFTDAYEFEGLYASASLLPQLTAIALTNAIIDQPGWRDGRKLAGRAFSSASKPLQQLDEREVFGHYALLNKENAVRVLDNTIDALQTLRNSLATGDQEALTRLYKHAGEGRATWLKQRQSGNWDTSNAPVMPSSGDSMKHFLVGGLFDRRPPEKKK